MRFSLLFASILLSAITANAAPVPSMDQKAAQQVVEDVFLKRQGVDLLFSPYWKSANRGLDNNLNSLRYVATNRPDLASLSIRIETVNAKITTEKHLRRWLREYPAYGFEVLSQQKFTLNGSEAIMVDLLSRAKNKQIRQVLVRQNQKIAVMTCLDNKDQFATTLQQCNSVMKTFKWSAASEAKKSI